MAKKYYKIEKKRFLFVQKAFFLYNLIENFLKSGMIYVDNLLTKFKGEKGINGEFRQEI